MSRYNRYITARSPSDIILLLLLLLLFLHEGWSSTNFVETKFTSMRRVNLWFEAVLRYLEIRPPRRYRMGQLRLSLRTSLHLGVSRGYVFLFFFHFDFSPSSLTLSFPYSALYDRLVSPYNFKRSSLFLTPSLSLFFVNFSKLVLRSSFSLSLSLCLSSPVSLHFRSIPWVERTYKFMIPLLAFFFAISRSPFLLGARSFASLFYSSCSSSLYLTIYLSPFLSSAVRLYL